MRTWAKGTARAALLTAGFVALGSTGVFSGAAFADTDGRNSVLGGNQVNLPISIPIDASGNAVGVLGEAAAGSKGGASVDNGHGPGTYQQTSGEGSIAGGNQVNAPISVPVNVCGNAVAVLGASGAGCKGGASVKGGSGHGGHGVTQVTSGEDSILGGNQVNAPISVPVNVCGNAVAVLGQAGAFCKGGASVKSGSGHGVTQVTSGEDSIGGGNQVNVPIKVPVNICGNSVAVLGTAIAGCNGGAGDGGDGGHFPPGDGGHLPPVDCDPCDGGHLPPGDSGDCDPCDGGNGDDGYDDGYDYGTRSALPVADEFAGMLPVAPGSAMPAMTRQLTGAAGSALPGEVSDLTQAVPGEMDDLTQAVPGEMGDLTEGLPGQPRETGRSAEDLPALPGELPAELTGNLPAGLSTAGPVPAGVGALQSPSDEAKATQVTEQPPVQPGVPVSTDAVTGKVGEASGAVGQVKDQVADMAPMSASEPTSAPAMSLLVLGGLLAAASAAAAVTRRLLPGRR